MRVFLDELHSYASSFLPESCNEYMQIDLLHLHEEYQGFLTFLVFIKP